MVLGYMPMPANFRYREVALRGRPQHKGWDAFSIKHPPMPASRWHSLHGDPPLSLPQGMKKHPGVFQDALPLFGFSTFLHVNCFLIEKKLLYPNVKDSIIILPWIDPISDHNEFSK